MSGQMDNQKEARDGTVLCNSDIEWVTCVCACVCLRAVPASLKRAAAFTGTGKQPHKRRRRRRQYEDASQTATLSRGQQRFQVTQKLLLKLL